VLTFHRTVAISAPAASSAAAAAAVEGVASSPASGAASSAGWRVNPGSVSTSKAPVDPAVPRVISKTGHSLT